MCIFTSRMDDVISQALAPRHTHAPLYSEEEKIIFTRDIMVTKVSVGLDQSACCFGMTAETEPKKRFGAYAPRATLCLCAQHHTHAGTPSSPKLQLVETMEIETGVEYS